jgi:hypothetical protein
MWNLPPPPGFQGLHPDKPLRLYERHLPHWRQEGATYFVTFRLGDSLPQAKLHELESLRREWERRHPPPRSNEDLEQLARETSRRVERWLDEGCGSCLLKHGANRQFLIEALHHFDVPGRTAFPGRPEIPKALPTTPAPRYELGSYVIMPNHVHAIVRPFDESSDPLEEIIGSWKQFSSTRIHRRTGVTGELWQAESYDRIIRDEEHLWRVLQYIAANPLRAKLAQDAFTLWLRPQWKSLGWIFEQSP